MGLAATLDKALRANGLAIVGVSIGKSNDRTTWKVHPPHLQDEAQSIIDNFDVNTVVEPRFVDSKLIISRMTDDENWELTKLAQTDKKVAKFMNLFLCRAGQVDVNDPLSIAGWAYIKSIGVPDIWPDTATADTRIAEITA